MPERDGHGIGIALAAGLGYVAALATTLIAWQVVDAERSARAMQEFGAATAEELAQAAVEPLLREDRIRLGLLANRLVARAEVLGIAVYTVDDEPFVLVGNLPADADVYVEQVAIQGTVAGYVRVALQHERFGLPAARLLADLGYFHGAGLVLTLAVAFAFHLLATGARREPGANDIAPRTPDADTGAAYVLVANLFRRPATNARRRAALDAGLAVAQRVANLYAGRAARLPGAGFLLVLPARTSAERGFEVVCAALLVRRLCAGPDDAEADEEATASAAFRYGLDLVDETPPVDGLAVSPAIRPVALLASLAPDGQLVLGEAASATIDRPERLRIAPFENPAIGALPMVAAPHGIVEGITAEHEALLARQAELIASTVA